MTLASWEKSYDQPRQHIKKSRDVTLPMKVRLVKAMVFPVVTCGCESWTIKKTKHQRIDTFKLWCWRRLWRIPWTVRRSNQSILKEISPEYSLEGLVLKVKLQYAGTWCEELFHLKSPWLWKRLKAGGEGDDRGWYGGCHYRLSVHEFESTPGAGDGQGGLVCCSPRACKELNMT